MTTPLETAREDFLQRLAVVDEQLARYKRVLRELRAHLETTGRSVSREARETLEEAMR